MQSIHQHNQRRGAVSFTLLLFMLLLITVALMYYYFMRTRALQAELHALKIKHPVALATGDTVLPEETPEPDTLGNALNNVSNAVQSTTRTATPPKYQTVPPAPTLTPLSNTAGSVTPVPTPTPFPPAIVAPTQTEIPTASPESAVETEPEETSAPDKPIKSMYDVERPAMKIRTPKRPTPSTP